MRSEQFTAGVIHVLITHDGPTADAPLPQTRLMAMVAVVTLLSTHSLESVNTLWGITGMHEADLLTLLLAGALSQMGPGCVPQPQAWVSNV